MPRGDLIERIREFLGNIDLPEPVSEREIHRAEEKIGFKLPLLLRRVYTEVGNGGFGPSNGLLPLFSLEPDARENEEGMINSYLSFLKITKEMDEVSDWDEERLRWPKKLLPFCYWGCAMKSCVDCSDPQFPVKLFNPLRFSLESPTLESWFERWLKGL